LLIDTDISLDSPISTPPKSKVRGERDKTGASPVPESETKPDPPLDEIATEPEYEPELTGENLTVITVEDAGSK
jgi:hypothetical protein